MNKEFKKDLYKIALLLVVIFCISLLAILKGNKSSTVAADTVSYPIRVLEIEPSGASKYNNYSSAKQILKWFGFKVKNIKSSNYKNYVTIDSIASNGFIGMNSDIVNDYDLVIIGDYNPKGYLASGALQGNGNYSPAGKFLKMNLSIESTGETVYAAFSGNDFTLKSLNKLMNFIDNGKPLVLANSIYNAINEKTSTNSSNYSVNVYKLAPYYLEKNGHNTSNIFNETKNISLNYISHPEISLDDDFKADYDSNKIINSKKVLASSLSSFEIYGQIGTTSESYDLDIYIDKNGDGIFSEIAGEEYELYYSSTRSTDSKITTDNKGNFRVSLALPTELRGYVGIKLVATNKTGGSCQDTGCIIVSEEDVSEVKVLQIVPLDDVTTGNFLLEDEAFMERFDAISDLVGIDLSIDSVSVNDFVSWYDGVDYEMNGLDIYDESKNKLYKYDMLVIGFYDNFNREDIESESALNNIEDFINSGRAVLFSHDNFIYSAYSDVNYENVKVLDMSSAKKSNIDTSFYLTSRFRNMAGMDRYGVSDKSVTSVAGANKATVFDDNYQGYTNLNLMRRGTDNGNPFKIYTNISDEINKSVLTTTNVRQLNKGQVTEYPYGIDESITVSKTHSQWFVVDLEATNSKLIDSSKDVVVWYALYSSDTGSYYHLSGVDALNNYYIYSKGNITYSGCGHSEVTKDAELKLFVNTVVKAIKSGNSTPKISSTTGIKTGSNSYEQAIRSNDLSYLSDLTTTTNYLRFTVTDIDMGISNGAYSYGRAFWDVDGDGSFTEGVDVILEEYEGDNCLRNKVENVLDLRDYLNLTNSEGITLYDSLTRGDLVITIYAEDVNKTRGTTSFNLARRDLFNLD